MQSKHPEFTYSYHFLSQAIIVFLLAIPFLHFGFEWVPYWSYLGVAAATAAIFLVYSRFGLPYGWYLASAPVIFGVFMLLNYPLLLSALFSVLLVWRFIAFRKEEVTHQENAYILYTLFLTMVMFVMVRDTELFLLLVIQFLILLFGYLLSHLHVSGKEESLGGSRFWLLITGILAAVTLLSIPLMNFGRVVVVQTWNALTDFLVFALIKLAELFPDIDMPSGREEFSPLPSEQVTEQKNEDMMETIYSEAPIPDFLIWLIILAALVVLYFIFKMFKRRFKPEEAAGASDIVSYSRLEEKEKESFIKRIFRRSPKKPDHPIRELVFDFEHAAARHDRGRREYETVEEWLERTDLKVDMTVYQKVRYGNKEVTSSEAETLKSQLKSIEQKLDGKGES